MIAFISVHVVSTTETWEACIHGQSMLVLERLLFLQFCGIEVSFHRFVKTTKRR